MMAKKRTKVLTRTDIFLKLLERLLKISAKSIYYTFAFLGVIAIYPNIHLPPELSILLSGLSVEAIGSLLDRVANNPDISDEQLKNEVDLVIGKSNLEVLLTKDSFFHAYSHLLKKNHQIKIIGEEILANLRAMENRIVASPGKSIGYPEARQIAQDVYDANFYKLAERASQMAKSRVLEMNNSLYSKMLLENASGLQSFQDPDFQYLLYESQKAYARSGDKNALEVSLDILISRSISSRNTLLLVTQNEAISTIPKLLPSHFHILSVLFVIYNLEIFIKNKGIRNTVERFRKYLEPLVANISITHSIYNAFDYLLELGCMSLTDSTARIAKPFGFPRIDAILTKDDYLFLFENSIISPELFSKVDGPDEQYQVLGHNYSQGPSWSFLPREELAKELKSMDLSVSRKEELIEEYATYRFASYNYFISSLEKTYPSLKSFQNLWSTLYKQKLSMKGLVIAASNLKRVTGEQYNILKWIG